MSIIRVFISIFIKLFSPTHKISLHTLKLFSQCPIAHILRVTNGDFKFQQYQKGPQLGQGGFAICYQATRKSDRKLFAMKVIRLHDKKEHSSSRDRHRTSLHPRQSTVQKVHTQAKLLKMCSHPSIVKHQTDFIYQNDFYIIMEFCQNGSLSEMLKARLLISQVEVRYYLRQMIEALQYLKERRIIHRDLKPANYLLTDKLKLKIADFGLATEVRNNVPCLKNVCGTPNYISPEMVKKEQYSYEVDLWAVGVIMYSMLYGSAPFQSARRTAQQTYENIKKCEYRLSDPRVSFQARDLISKILVLDPKKRISLEDIFKHPFMANFDIPPELSVRFLRKEPNQRFLEIYQTYRNRLTLKAQKQKQFQTPQTQTRKNSLQKSFSSGSECHLSQKALKKDRKRQKKEKKYQQRQNKPKKRTLADILKKCNQEDVLTSSPFSEVESHFHSKKNKWIQYTSDEWRESSQFSSIDKKELNPTNIGQSIKNKGSINREFKQNVSNQIKGQTDQKIVFESFPSFGSMLKNLSFSEMLDEKEEENRIFDNLSLSKHKRNMKKQKMEEAHKKVKLDYNKIKILSREFNKITNNSKPSEKQQKNYNKQASQKDYVVEDFQLFTSSMYLASQKMMKIIYCLRQLQVQGNTKTEDTTPFNVKQGLIIRFIGIIYNDNSSIVTKIVKQNQFISNKSIYICNLNFSANNIHKNSFSKLLSSHNFEQSFHEKTFNSKEKFLSLGLNIFDFYKTDKETEQLNQKKINLQVQSLSSDVRLKIRYAQDALKYFCFLVRQNPLNSILRNYNFQKQSEKITNLWKEQDDYAFVTFFSSKENQKKVYFQLNNSSKHFLSLSSQKIYYQNLFNNSLEKKPKFNLYDSIVFNSINKKGFIRKKEGKLKILKGQHLRSILCQNYNESSQVKKQEQDSNQYEQDKGLMKNDTVKNKQSFRISFSKAQIMKTNHEVKKINPPVNLISDLCLSFRQKMQFYYLRQRQMLSEIHQKERQGKNRDNQEKPELQNRCEIQMNEGQFDLLINGKQNSHSIMVEENTSRKL